MGFPRQEYWTGLPFLSLSDLPNPGIEPISPVSPSLAGGLPQSHQGSPKVIIRRIFKKVLVLSTKNMNKYFTKEEIYMEMSTPTTVKEIEIKAEMHYF